MPKPAPPIKTIQFLDISFKNRAVFLDFIKKHVIEFALNKQELFKAAHCNAEYFHKATNSTTKTNVLIHSLSKDSVFTLRAYTEKGIKTLEFWYQLFKIAQPTKCIHVIESTEYFTYKLLKKPIYYTSYNWVPYTKVIQQENNIYLNKISAKNLISNASFKDRLQKNLENRFLKKLMGIKTVSTIKITQFKRATSYKNAIAFDTKPRTPNGKPLTHQLFKVSFAVNVQLPSYFSLGQRVSYGLGVFERDTAKNRRYEKQDHNL